MQGKCVCVCFDRSDIPRESARSECTVQRVPLNLFQSQAIVSQTSLRLVEDQTCAPAAAPYRSGRTPGMCGSVWVPAGRESCSPAPERERLINRVSVWGGQMRGRGSCAPQHFFNARSLKDKPLTMMQIGSL